MRGALSKISDGDVYKRCSHVGARHCLSASVLGVGKASSAAGEMEEVPATEDLPVRRKRKASETISANPLLRYFKASLGSKHASTASVSSTGMLSSEQDESNREQERNFL